MTQGAGFFTFSAGSALSKEYCPFCYITIKIFKNSIEQFFPVLYNDFNKTVLLYNSKEGVRGMDCPVCGGNGDLDCFKCMSPMAEGQEHHDCPLCEGMRVLPCSRCSGNGYLEQEA